MRAMRRTVPQLGNMAPDKAASAERDLLPLFKQVAVEFAALHDTPGVMRHKGAVSAVVPWAESREFFARHLRARLAAERLRRDALAASPALDLAQLAAVLAELKPHVDAAVAEARWEVLPPSPPLSARRLTAAALAVPFPSRPSSALSPQDGPVTMDSPELRAYFRQLRSRHIRAEVGRLYAEDGPAVRAAVPAAANGVSP